MNRNRKRRGFAIRLNARQIPKLQIISLSCLCFLKTGSGTDTPEKGFPLK